MTEPPAKPPGKPVPMTEWLGLMLAEIDRKDAEARAASEERRRRDTTPEDPAGDARSADVA